MERFKQPIVGTLFILILSLCDVSMATMEEKMENQKSNYIVYVDKSEMPASFEHHSVWYESLLKSISDSAEMLYSYDNIHGFSTSITAEEAQLLKSQTGIVAVLPERVYQLHTTRTPHFLGLDPILGALPQSDYDVIIGVLDTGVWPESKSFDDTGMGPIPKRWKGQCESGTNFTTSNCNKKLIGARFFNKGRNSMLGPLDETKHFESPRDDVGHGTHTMSTTAGSVVKGASLFGYASGTASGMAPRARVAMYKVCWGESCFTSDIVAAMDKAISDNVNVLSLSLGGIPLEYSADPLAIGAFAAMEKGILVSSSAGNDGPEEGSVTNVAPWITTVGAGTIDRDFPSYITLGNGKNYSGVSVYKGQPLPNTPVPFINAASAGNLTDSQFCANNSLERQKVAGKVVLCDRGFGGRAEKGFVVKSAGGLGMVLANTEDNGEETTVDAHILPTVAVGVKEGNAMKKYLSSDPNPTVNMTFLGTKIHIQPSPVVALFSSRGPNPITPEILKPDIIAPGVNILAAWTKSMGPSDSDMDPRRVDFNIVSGTSMSCPHVAGIAALVKSFHSDWSPAAIRSALLTTAYTNYKNGQKLLDSATGRPSTPLVFGAGYVNPDGALNPGLVYDLTVDDYLDFLCTLDYTPEQIKLVTKRQFQCDKTKKYSVAGFNYPSFVVLFNNSNGGSVVHKHKRTLTNVGVAGTYKVSFSVDTPYVKIAVEPDVLSFKENEKKSYTVSFTSSDDSKLHRPAGFHFGRLEWSNGKSVVGSPIIFSWESL